MVTYRKGDKKLSFDIVGGKANNTNQPQIGEYEPLKGHEEPTQTGPFKPSDIAPDDLPFY